MDSTIYCFYNTTLQCNRNCSYCMALNKRTVYKTPYKLIINKLNSLQVPIVLDFTGGEPTFYNEFDDVLLYSIKTINKLKEVVISTNGNLGYNFKKLEIYTEKIKIHLIITIHLENFDNRILDSIEELANLHIFNLNIEIRIAFKPNYYELVQYIIDRINKINLYKRYLLYLNSDNIVYSIDELSFMRNINTKWGIPDIFITPISHKGTFCVLHGLSILPNGKFFRCSVSNENNSSNIISKDYIYTTKNEELINPIIVECMSDACSTVSMCHKNFTNKKEAILFTESLINKGI